MDELLKGKLAPLGAEGTTAESTVPSASDPRPQPASEAEVINCLLQAAEELNSSLELDDVLHKVAKRVKQHIEYDTFAIHLLDPLGQELRIRFGLGQPPEVIKHWRFGLGQGIVGTVAQTRQPLRINDVSRDPRYINAFEGIAAELAIPLIVKNRTIGVLDVGSRQPHYFTESHQRILTFLAGHLANAIENARLYENLREQARMLSLLHEISRELASLLDREQLLRKVAQMVKRLIDYQGFHVLLLEGETQVLEHIFSLRYDERITMKGGLPLGTGLCGTAAALRQPVRVPNVHLDPRYVRGGDGADVRSELVVPLVFKDRLIGVLDLESTEYDAFSEQHQQIMSTLASYVAIALENARLYEKVRSGEQRLEKDLATAREIQRGLLPETAPRLPGLDIGFAYAPARELGGDVYDFLPYGDGRLAIAVGDVAGKASAAALYGSLAIGILRGHVVQHPCEPAEMLELMNQHLHQPRLDNRFVALAFAVYDSPSRTLTVANSGFPRPWRACHGQVEQVQVEGVPLGLLPDVRYEQKKLALQVGDAIVFCSDGLHEAMDKTEKEFGREELERILAGISGRASAQEIADELLRATERYTAGNGDHADDRTVVVLKLTRE